MAQVNNQQGKKEIGKAVAGIISNTEHGRSSIYIMVGMAQMTPTAFHHKPTIVCNISKKWPSFSFLTDTTKA